MTRDDEKRIGNEKDRETSATGPSQEELDQAASWEALADTSAREGLLAETESKGTGLTVQVIDDLFSSDPQVQQEAISRYLTEDERAKLEKDPYIGNSPTHIPKNILIRKLSDVVGSRLKAAGDSTLRNEYIARTYEARTGDQLDGEKEKNLRSMLKAFTEYENVLRGKGFDDIDVYDGGLVAHIDRGQYQVEIQVVPFQGYSSFGFHEQLENRVDENGEFPVGIDFTTQMKEGVREQIGVSDFHQNENFSFERIPFNDDLTSKSALDALSGEDFDRALADFEKKAASQTMRTLVDTAATRNAENKIMRDRLHELGVDVEELLDESWEDDEEK